MNRRDGRSKRPGNPTSRFTYVFPLLLLLLTRSQQNPLQSIEDQLLAGAHKGYPVTNFNLPATIRCYRVFDPSTCSRKRELPKPTGSDNFRITYEWTSRMLSAAANTLVTLKSRVKVEIICTDLFSELQLMRNGEDHHRPKEFPRSFLRVWMSNIP